ncbi:MAG: hypothetical protein KAJ98_01590 [Spirochaetaceae bacterium]|nr:hypothetical protein [Spirochaetaceae bacterium]
MSEERRKILDMLSEGKINAEEAEKLLDAVEPKTAPAAGESTFRGGDGLPKYLYVRVDPKEGAGNADQVKVTVPLALVKAGMNFASLLPRDARRDVEKAMESKGFDFDLKNMKDGDMDDFLAALRELEVDIETSENTVKIYTG